jgi:hypothetical protein
MVSTGTGTVRSTAFQPILNQFRNQPSAFAWLRILIDYSDRVAEMEMSTGVAAFLISTMF